MGILGRDRTQQSASTGSTLVGSDTHLVGNLTLSDDLHLDGRIDGDIQSSANVTIGTSGRLEGEIRAQRVLVSGRVNGRIEADRLEIIAGGEVEGAIVTVDLVIEPGGRFNGSSEIRAADVNAAAAEPVSKNRREKNRDNSEQNTEGSSSPA